MNRHFGSTNEGRDRRFAGRGGAEKGTQDRPGHGRGGRERGGMENEFGGRGRGGRGHGGHGHGFGRRDPDGLGRSFGEGRGRLFDSGDIKLVILKLLSEQPSYGYQLIKTMEQRVAGGYTPSAGVIYPTLTLIEEEGLASASTGSDNRRIYSLTAEGRENLEANKERIGLLFVRLEEAGRGFKRGRSPEIVKAFTNLKGAVAARVSRETVKAEQIRKIAEAINAAAKAIDEL